MTDDADPIAPAAAPPFSAPTLVLFARLLRQTTLSAGAEDFDTVAATISTARRELAEAMTSLDAAD